MPIYEYECTGCGKVFEIFQKIADEPLKECRECSGRLHRLISNCSFQLKGSGWYVTDYKTPADAARGNGAKKAETKEETTEAKKEPKAETKSETTTTTTTTKSEAAGSAP